MIDSEMSFLKIFKAFKNLITNMFRCAFSWTGYANLKELINSIALPVAIALIGYYTNSTIAEKDRLVKYIEFASNLLNTQKDPDIRDWAVDVINYYSEVKMTGKVKQAITGKGELKETPDTISATGVVSDQPKK